MRPARSSPVPRFLPAAEPAPWLQPNGAFEATSFYETKLLKSTLERLVDFDRINAGEMRLSVGAVNVRTGNLVYFDNDSHTIRPEHVMASGALPLGFPAVEIEGEFYWYGGLISNTPQWVVAWAKAGHLAFQDLGARRGSFRSEVARGKRKFSTEGRGAYRSVRYQRARHTLASLSKLPADLLDSEEATTLARSRDHKVYKLVHPIHSSKQNEGHPKDYELRLSMEHWRAGY
jgi:NTE family protein